MVKYSHLCPARLDIEGRAWAWADFFDDPSCVREVNHPGMHLVIERDGKATNFSNEFTRGAQ